MPLTRVSAAQAMAELSRYHAVIDARAPGEFAEDRLPGAVNWPSLNDAERQHVGTVYKQVSSFEAKRQGAVLVARNIARHVEANLMTVDRSWRPLVYCWRGGQRSGALSHVLSQIGFQVAVLDGGYKAFRAEVRTALEALPAGLSFRVICGPTGCGKTRLLQALRANGAQVLDLEALARHRGSVLGAWPDAPQPTQKAFETELWQALIQLDAKRPVFVESESKKIGKLRVPDALILRIRGSVCLSLEMTLGARVQLLMQEYIRFCEDIESFCAQLELLGPLRGKATVEAWQAMARGGHLDEAVQELLVHHYDPVYLASMKRNFPQLQEAARLDAADGSPAAMQALAHQLAGGAISPCADHR